MVKKLKLHPTMKLCFINKDTLGLVEENKHSNPYLMWKLTIKTIQQAKKTHSQHNFGW